MSKKGGGGGSVLSRVKAHVPLWRRRDLPALTVAIRSLRHNDMMTGKWSTQPS